MGSTRVLLQVFLITCLWLGLSAPGFAGGVDRTYTTAELIDGFMRTVFGREGPTPVDGAGAYVNKFVDPVPVLVLNSSAKADRTADVARFVKQLSAIVPNLKIRMAKNEQEARMVVFLTDRRNYRSVVAEALPRGKEPAFMEGNFCSAILWDRTSGVLDRAYVFIVVDEGEKFFQGCLAEEITQALGPANDSDALPHSLYNDSNDVNRFELFDWYILSALYDDAVLAGMTEAEVGPVLSGVIKRLRLKAPAAAMALR